MKTFRHTLAAATLAALATTAAAQNYPSKPIRMIAPFPNDFSICETASPNAFARSDCCADVVAIICSEVECSARPLADYAEHSPKPSRNATLHIYCGYVDNLSTEKAFSTCLTRIRSPSTKTPITSKRYDSDGRP
mgnify:CR=1 FL=1